VEVWIAECQPRDIATIFKFFSLPNVNRRFIHQYTVPLDILANVDIRHLRRIRRNLDTPDGPPVHEVVLCGAESISRQELAALIWKHCDEVPPLRPRLALASKWAPYTLEQYKSFSNLWPVRIRREAKK